MAGQEISFIVDWSVWTPILISGAAFLLTTYQFLKKSGKDKMSDVEKKVDRAHASLKDCESNLKRCGYEKDELRRENVELLRRVARMDTDGNG